MIRQEQSRRAAESFAEFSATPLDEALTRHTTCDPRAEAIALFHRVATSVPAYRRFLDEHGVEPSEVRSFSDFEALPVINKQNYVSKNTLSALCWDGRIEGCDMIAVSSGSTGKPTFWPRFVSDEFSVARRFEQVFHDSFRADEKKTLAVVCFALGTWVGGMFTTACCRHLAAKGYPITVITPGNNKDEIFRVLADLGPSFEQTVLLGYPPFLKDVIDTGRARGFDFGPLHVKLVMAGEVFSEEWRALVGERLGSTSPCHDSASLYGTADAGVLGNETPLSIAIRRFLAARPDAARALFGESRLPTLLQYDPLSRFFEEKERMLLFTGNNGAPLVRYAILDRGGVYSYDEMLAQLRGHGFDLRSELLGDRGARPLPFVYVFGRSDFTVSYFGANIYPENVTVGLEQAGIKEWVTGKFVLEVGEGEDKNPFLSVAVELAPGEAPSAARHAAVTASIEAELCRLNSEFKNYVPAEYRTPRVALIPAGDPSYFPVGVKHRYTRG